MEQQWKFMVLVVLGVLLNWSQGAEAVILINEILADPPALVGDANQDGVISSTQDEFIELVNPAADPLSLAGWTLSDVVQVRHVFSTTASIPGDSFFVVFGGGIPQGFTDVAVASTGGLSLNNSGDTVTLRDASGTIVDVYTYGAEGGMDVSLTRSPDATGSFVKHSAVSNDLFSPGTTIDGRLYLSPPDPPSPDDSEPVVPEPTSIILLGLGLLGVRRRSTKRLSEIRSDFPPTSCFA